MEEGIGGADANRLMPAGSASETPINDQPPKHFILSEATSQTTVPPGARDAAHLFASRDCVDEERAKPARRGLVRNRDDPTEKQVSVWLNAEHRGYDWTLGRKAQLCPPLACNQGELLAAVTVSSYETPPYKRARIQEDEQRLHLDQFGSAHSLKAKVEQWRTSAESGPSAREQHLGGRVSPVASRRPPWCSM